ncbi:dedicator of cytokinesis protein 9-like [Liolophura sinensis]|uniref:dedicator of cytokinesis protein 9-like n=1 Tax=Liolophura sinensis TaxID=3198878 RepID=UPI003158F8CC
MGDRAFTKGLMPGTTAARLRQSAAEAMKQTAVQSRPKSVEPIDYETFVVKNKTLLHNDPQVHMLNFPHDDVSEVSKERKFRTVRSTVPKNATKEASSLLVRECIRTYTSDWHLVEYKYKNYSGNYRQLPNQKSRDALPEHVFEIDAEAEEKDEELNYSRSLSSAVTKKGWLFKGPEGKDKDIIISFTRQFKRRFFILKQQADFTYVLQFYKDDKKQEARGAIFLDIAQDVVRNTKKGKFCFEVQMQNGQHYLFGAENESELEEWMQTLKRVIHVAETGSQASTDSRSRDDLSTPDKGDGKKESAHGLVKYSRETETALTKARQEGRHKMFDIFPDMQRAMLPADLDEAEDNVDEVYPEQLGSRYYVQLKDFQLKLQVSLNVNGEEKNTNPEPFFITLALYDAKAGKKISEDFHIDPNVPEIRSMIPPDILQASDKLHTVEGKQTAPDLDGLQENWLKCPQKQAIFSIQTQNKEDIYLFAKVEKVLQGGISNCTEPYIKLNDPKMGSKVHRQMRQYCSHIGHYKMPFGWAAKPMFKPFSRTVDNISDFMLYKQEGSKMSEEEIIKHLQDFRKPEKQSKWQVIPAVFKVTVEELAGPIPDSLTSSLVPVKPFNSPPSHIPTIEVEEFIPEKGDAVSPFMSYVNHLYVYPHLLKYDSQKHFTKARNIACCVEIRDSDHEGAIPLKRIYGRPGVSVFTTVTSTTVLHHNTTPDFNEEVKIALPTQLHEKHHLLFKFYHVSCEASKSSGRNSSVGTSRKRDHIEVLVGFAWLPLLHQGRPVNGERNLQVAANLPAGYVSHEPFGMGKGSAGPDIRYVDGGRQLFKVGVRLVSTVYTRDQHLHNFFHHCQRMENGLSPAVDLDTNNKLKQGEVTQGSDMHILLNAVKSLHAVDVSTFVQFLPTIINQLFRLLPQTSNDDVALNAVRVLIHIVSEVDAVGKIEALFIYVKYVFMTESCSSTAKHPNTVHDELAKNLISILRPGNADQLVVNRFLKHAWFFCEIIVKSMAQHLIQSKRIKMPRNERFSSDFQYRIKTVLQYLVPHIVQKYRDLPTETRRANTSVAEFIKGCFMFMDRGFVFKLVKAYMENFSIGDPKSLQEYKFDFLRIVCSHEQYIPLCLPLMRRGLIKNYKVFSANQNTDDDSDDVFCAMEQGTSHEGASCACCMNDVRQDYTLSEEFRKNHYLVGLILQELKTALQETRDIRKCAITVLRNLLAKHSADDRYATKSQQGRIAALYLPFISILLENKNRLMRDPDRSPAKTPAPIPNGDVGKGEPTEQHRAAESARPARDSQVFAMIAGNVPHTMMTLNVNGHAQNGSVSSLTSDDVPEKEVKGHERTHSQAGQVPSATNTFSRRFDKLEQNEIRDLLVCFLYIAKNIPEDILLGWFNNASDNDRMDFFTLLEICLHQFKYIGRRKIVTLSAIGDSKKARTLPPRRSVPNTMLQRPPSQYSDLGMDEISSTSSDAEAMMRALREANMATEIGMVVLDILSLYCSTFKQLLEAKDGDNPVMRRVFQLYLMFLRTSQSETLQKHAFAAWRMFIQKFPTVLFRGNALLCGDLCYEILRCCNSKLNSTRKEACGLLYILMKSNFEFSHKTSFTRVHLQVIISVSQLIGDVVGLSNSRFQDSLAMINNYANSDKSMQRTAFPGEVKDLTKRIRTVLMATAQMKEHENDPEMLVDLQYSLAKSYASTPELRKTWLETMAKIHNRNSNFSEAAYCYIHIAALVAEYLMRRGKLPRSYPQGCSAFSHISPNIQPEESGIKDDSGMQDVQYTEDNLVEFLEQAARALTRAERYELLGEVYKLIIPVYEQKREFDKLASSYQELYQAYTRVVEVTQSGRRLLGQYFRVAFFGQSHFEDEDGKQYIYKEPKVTSLAELCGRLEKMYSEKFGRDNVKLIKDSKMVEVSSLDPKFAYIQVTHVTPYFTDAELAERQTDFERNNNLKNFMFETPFTKEGKPRGSIPDQYKLRTVLTTSHAFPYVKKRIPVVSQRDHELSPIEGAIDEMQRKVQELQDVVAATTPDFKKLQLKLQGSVSVQVHAGPMVYAEAFLAPKVAPNYPKKDVAQLKKLFRQFVQVCDEALELNLTLISSDQKDYHEQLRNGFHKLVTELEAMFGEKLATVDNNNQAQRNSMMVFNMTAAGSASTA